MSSVGDTHIGDVEICAREHAVLVRGNDVALSSREFEILKMLAEHPGWVFSTSQLSKDPEDGDYSPESVSVLVSRIRHKLAEAGAPDVVETVRGVGYRLHSARASADDPAGGVATVSRELRDAAWQLQEAAIEAEHSGSVEQQHAAAAALEHARRAIFASLAE